MESLRNEREKEDLYAFPFGLECELGGGAKGDRWEPRSWLPVLLLLSGVFGMSLNPTGAGFPFCLLDCAFVAYKVFSKPHPALPIGFGD